MTVLQGFLLGLLQGITEFLPVSSSAHLALAQIWLGLDQPMLLFDICLHFGTLLSLLLVFWPDMMSLGKAVFEIFHLKEKTRHRAQVRLLLLLLIATAPLALAVFFGPWVEAMMRSPWLIGSALLLTAIVIILTCLSKDRGKNERSATVGDTLLVGLAQLLAVFPGVSRSGLTISTSLYRGFSRSFAFRFSFLLSIPAVLGAIVLDVPHAFGSDSLPIAPVLIGILTAFITGVVSLLLVQKLVERKKFSIFAWYCMLLGAGVIYSCIIQKTPLFV